MLVQFWPKYNKLSTGNVTEISSYLSSLQIGSTTYTFTDGYNPTTKRFDMAYVTSPNAAAIVA